MRRSLYNAAVAMIATISLGAAAHDVLGAQVNLEYEVKAAFLYNFAKFVEWPSTAFVAPEAPLVFCIIGPNPFDGRLERVVNDRTANGRRIEVREEVAASQTSGCHLVFIPETEGGSVARLVHASASVPSTPVLTIGESEGFVEEGGMIQLVVDDGRVRFDINAAAAERQGLRLSSQLLKLARRVEK
jgi:hypothetical protein